jgi:hypothetical protein
MTVKTPKIDYKKIDGFKSFSDFHKDAIYTVALIKETYPRLMTKYLILTNNLLNSYKKSSQITTEKDFDIVQKFIAILKDGHSDYSIDYKKYDKTKYGIFLFKEKESCFR